MTRRELAEVAGPKRNNCCKFLEPCEAMKTPPARGVPSMMAVRRGPQDETLAAAGMRRKPTVADGTLPVVDVSRLR